LFEPVDANFAAHGIFDNRARNLSMEVWLDLHREQLLAGGGLLLGCAAALFWKNKNGRA
jgi:hypothetical protein